jgi:enamine deaminase RidA (YjgF/YER057c/UK114 family)
LEELPESFFTFGKLNGTIIFTIVLKLSFKLMNNTESLTPDQAFEKLGLTLPPAPSPLGVYKPYLIDGKHLYLSGHGPFQNDKSLIIGRIGQDMDIEEGKLAARQVGLTMLSTIKTHLGSLNRVKRVIKVLGMINCVSEFERHPYVINGCSELFAQVWGTENGIGVRSAVGMGTLPDNIPVEIEAMFELVE